MIIEDRTLGELLSDPRIAPVAADAILGIICLALAAKNGRLRELGMKHEQLVEAGVA